MSCLFLKALDSWIINFKMSKLPSENQFFDLSDYGRPIARWIARSLKNTKVTPIHVTFAFIVSGVIAIYCILTHHYLAATFFLILKSILDAADGALARIKNTPSFTGRYFDSVSDIILNFFILLSICIITKGSFVLMLLAFFGIQLQGTLYNYYYVILRNKFDGDKTSRVFETQIPVAMKGEKQENVNILFRLYKLLYGAFDKTIYNLDKSAVDSERFPKWLMTLVSTFGLGFQLLIIGLMLVLDLEDYIFLFFIGYSVFILVFIEMRKFVNQ